MSRRYYSSIAERTTLSFSVDATTTTFFVNAVVGWPSNTPYTLLVDADTINEEIVTVTGRSGTTLTVVRGVDGSTARAHDAGADVRHGVSARDFDEPNAFINSTGVITENLLASDSVTEAKIGTGAVTEAKIGTGAVTSTKILDGTIVNADINASAAIAQSKIADLTADLGSKLNIAGGKILQIVRSTNGTERSTTSTSFTDVTGSTVTITPQRADSTVLIIATFRAGINASTDDILAAFAINDSSNNPIPGAENQSVGTLNITGNGTRGLNSAVTLIARDTPASTNAKTYKLRFAAGVSTTTVFISNNLTTGQMFAIEVSA